MRNFVKFFLVALVVALVGSTSALAQNDDASAKINDRFDTADQLETWYLGPSLANADGPTLKMWFHEAPSSIHDSPLPLKGLPLWHTNGELSDEKIHEIYELGQANGFGGITFLPLGRTTPKYLSDEYMTQYGKALDLADLLGMKMIFYDDVDFPSGLAGGRLKEQFPDSTLKRLDKVEWEIQGPATLQEKSSIPLEKDVLFGREGGVLQAAIAMNLDTFERINIRDRVDAEGNVKWDAPEGRWKVMLFVCVSDPKGLVDYMSPKSVKNFFSLTYDRFYDMFKDHFGTTIKAIFFDDITNTQTQGSRNWALEFNDKYRAMWNRDPELDYPALFYTIGDETPSARYRLWSTRNRLFADGYPGMVRQWRVDRGLHVVSTGHPQGPYVIQPVDMCADAIGTHRGSDAVLFDSIHYYGHGRDGFKVPTSAAFNYDYPLCFVEIYGNYRDNTFDSSMMMRSAMEIFARGGNVLLPHGVWSDPKTVYIPPEISWRNPKLGNGFLAKYGEYVSRNQMLLRGGRHVADFAVLYPVDSLKSFFHFQYDFEKGDYPYGIYIPRETDYLAIGSQLTSEIWRDFTFLHPEIVDAKCSVEKKGDETLFKMNNLMNWEEFKVVVLPGADVISLANLRKVEEFYDAGGRVIATTRLPSIAAEGPEDNAKVCEIVEKIFGVNPLTQAPRDAIRTGQEDIVLPTTFRHCREVNKGGEYQPKLADELVEYEEPIYRERAVFLPRPTTEALRAAADKLIPVPDVKIEPVEGTEMPILTVTPRWDYPIDGMFQYIHKVKNDVEIYLFANSSNRPAEFNATLRGVFRWIDLWNPVTGETTRIDGQDCVTVDKEKGTTTIRMSLKAIDSAFILGMTEENAKKRE